MEKIYEIEFMSYTNCMKDEFLWAVGWLIAFIGLFLLAPLYPIVIIGDSIRGINR